MITADDETNATEPTATAEEKQAVRRGGRHMTHGCDKYTATISKRTKREREQSQINVLSSYNTLSCVTNIVNHQ